MTRWQGGADVLAGGSATASSTSTGAYIDFSAGRMLDDRGLDATGGVAGVMAEEQVKIVRT